MGLKRVPHYSTIAKAEKRLLTEGGASGLLEATLASARRSGLIGQQVAQAAIDSTGYDNGHMSAYYGRRSGKQKHRFPKFTALMDTESHLYLSGVMNEGPFPDHREFGRGGEGGASSRGVRGAAGRRGLRQRTRPPARARAARRAEHHPGSARAPADAPADGHVPAPDGAAIPQQDVRPAPADRERVQPGQAAVRLVGVGPRRDTEPWHSPRFISATNGKTVFSTEQGRPYSCLSAGRQVSVVRLNRKMRLRAPARNVTSSASPFSASSSMGRSG